MTNLGESGIYRPNLEIVQKIIGLIINNLCRFLNLYTTMSCIIPFYGYIFVLSTNRYSNLNNLKNIKPMKKSISTTFLISALLVMSSFALNATNHNQIAKNAKESVRRELIRNITCPDFIEGDDATNQVKAVVSIDNNGNVAVEDINSANPRLTNYVKGQLEKMKVNSLGQTQKFVLVINFKAA